MILNICAMPSWTPPSRVPTAGTPSTSPNRSSQVVETLRPILCSTLVTKAPLRSPRAPVSRSTWYCGTTNSDSPFVPGPAPSGRASTRWTMLSCTSLTADVMKRFTPVMCQLPSGCCTALARPAPRAGVGLGEHHRGAPAVLHHVARQALLVLGAEGVHDLGEGEARAVH